jgi:hypothetical protein
MTRLKTATVRETLFCIITPLGRHQPAVEKDRGPQADVAHLSCAGLLREARPYRTVDYAIPATSGTAELVTPGLKPRRTRI